MNVLLGAFVATSLACTYDIYGFGSDPYEPPACGDGKVEAPEECDPGPDAPEEVLRLCTPLNCTLVICGDGKPEGDEQCDDGKEKNDDFGECSTACRKVTFCGDGVIQRNEECDDGAGNTIHSDCTPSCTKAKCGDNLLWDSGGGKEECDDGNDNNSDTCTTQCKASVCGDGFVGPNEQCDGDSKCEADCTFKGSICGNSTLEDGEECDDPTNEMCSMNCLFRKCGDGIVDEGEECDELEIDEAGMVCRGCKWYLKNTWYFPTKTLPARKIPDDVMPANINLPGLEPSRSRREIHVRDLALISAA